jgi:pyruvate,water dikinase
MVQLNGELACFYGEGYFRKIRSLLNIKAGETPEGIQEISGLVASPGIMRGRVKIVKEKKDMNKILPGDILVATTTRPELMPAIRRCAAIITDAGGITSHAAIVSREFKIPCIVNTKIATQVLKDGDMVEVNANKGVVKIL